MGHDADRGRFDAIVVPHLADALALARWLCGNVVDAEDVVQEASLRAYRAINTYAGGDTRAWVLTIVRNTAYTWLGKNRSSALVSFEGISPAERETMELAHAFDCSSAATPETDLISKVDAARLEAAIAALPMEFREAFVLREVHGLDYRQIADVTAAPLGTVMSRLARARRRLVEDLGVGQT
jgi:RNA polymerase sigma factor (sigma-70 family)